MVLDLNLKRIKTKPPSNERFSYTLTQEVRTWSMLRKSR